MYNFHARWSNNFPHQVCIALSDANITLCDVYLNFFGCWYPIEQVDINKDYVFCFKCVLKMMQAEGLSNDL